MEVVVKVKEQSELLARLGRVLLINVDHSEASFWIIPPWWCTRTVGHFDCEESTLLGSATCLLCTSWNGLHNPDEYFQNGEIMAGIYPHRCLETITWPSLEVQYLASILCVLGSGIQPSREVILPQRSPRTAFLLAKTVLSGEQYCTSQWTCRLNYQKNRN